MSIIFENAVVDTEKRERPRAVRKRSILDFEARRRRCFVTEGFGFGTNECRVVLAKVQFAAIRTLAEEGPLPVIGDLGGDPVVGIVDEVGVHHPEIIGCGAGRSSASASAKPRNTRNTRYSDTSFCCRSGSSFCCRSGLASGSRSGAVRNRPGRVRGQRIFGQGQGKVSRNGI